MVSMWAMQRDPQLWTVCLSFCYPGPPSMSRPCELWKITQVDLLRARRTLRSSCLSAGLPATLRPFLRRPREP